MDEFILLVEDDEQFGEILKDFFEDNGLSLLWAKDGATAERMFRDMHPHIILLDVALPDKEGFEVASEIRKLDAMVPIIFITGTALDVENYEKAYRQLRAVNYIEKPVIPQKLLPQIMSLLRPSHANEYKIEGYHIIIKDQLLTINNHEFVLRDKEYQILNLLLQNVNMTVKSSDLLKRVWGTDEFIVINSLHKAISNIRKVFKDFPGFEIETTYANGYRFLIKDK